MSAVLAPIHEPEAAEAITPLRLTHLQRLEAENPVML